MEVYNKSTITLRMFFLSFLPFLLQGTKIFTSRRQRLKSLCRTCPGGHPDRFCQELRRRSQSQGGRALKSSAHPAQGFVGWASQRKMPWGSTVQNTNTYICVKRHELMYRENVGNASFKKKKKAPKWMSCRRYVKTDKPAWYAWIYLFNKHTDISHPIPTSDIRTSPTTIL